MFRILGFLKLKFEIVFIQKLLWNNNLASCLFLRCLPVACNRAAHLPTRSERRVTVCTIIVMRHESYVTKCYVMHSYKPNDPELEVHK